MATELSFQPQQVNLTLYRNDTNTFSILLKDEAGVSIPLTGVTTLMQIRDDVISTGALLASITPTLDLLTNAIVVTVSPSDFATWDWVTGFYDLQLTFPSGLVKSIIAGSIRIAQDISR